ncbi:ArnT family glycosyltransferase [Pseudomonas sp. Pseusp122]|uniref:ArnT family glycosyltransferase n=1 Tax=unclassified Pseudomonas TaxID=196821 RepID=UPI0039A76052
MIARPLLLLLLAGVLFFLALGNHQLQNSTEPRVAGIAMQMHLTGDWVTPKLNNQPFLEKPPLSVWLDASAIRVFGANTGAVRLASALAGLLSLLLLYAMLCRFGRPVNIACGAAFLLATTASFWSNVRQVGEDALLALGVMTALLAFFQATVNARAHHRQTGTWLLFALGMVISTLSKGVLGLALPGVVIFAYLLSESILQRRLGLADWLRPAAFTLLALLPLVVWLCFLYRDGGAEAVREVLWTNSVGRFSGSFEEAGHYEAFYYYLARLFEAFLPWNLLVYVGLWHFRKQLASDRYLRFFSLWLIAQLLLLSLSSSKRMVYLMSLAPAAAVIAAEYLAVLREQLMMLTSRSSLAASVARHTRLLAIVAMTLVVGVYLVAAVWLAPLADKELSFVPLMQRVQALTTEGRHVVLFQPSERLAGASVFYRQSIVDAIASEAQLNSFLMASPDNIAVMESRREPAPPLKILSRFTVGDRTYYFVSR